VPISLLNPLEMVKDNMSEQEVCPLGDHSKLFREPLVQALLDHLPIPSVKADITISFPIAKMLQERGKLIIAGYASVEVIDSQNELIPIPVLKEAWENFKDSGFNIGSLMHTNIPVIKVLPGYVDSKGQVWKSGVDDTGLFIVAEVREDIEKGKQTRELIENEKLTGFSIGGEALASEVVCEGTCYTRIDKMELHEIAVVDKPANKPSVFTIVKRMKGEPISKPFAGYKDFADCVRQNQNKNNPEAYCASIQRTVEGKKKKKSCACPILVAINKLDKAINLIKQGKWITINGRHILINTKTDFNGGIYKNPDGSLNISISSRKGKPKRIPIEDPRDEKSWELLTDELKDGQSVTLYGKLNREYKDNIAGTGLAWANIRNGVVLYKPKGMESGDEIWDKAEELAKPLKEKKYDLVILKAISRLDKAISKMEKNGRPPKDWWEACTSRARSFADDPDKFCGWLWTSGPADLRTSFGKIDKSIIKSSLGRLEKAILQLRKYKSEQNKIKRD